MNITINDLHFIIGTWEGRGHAEYPTIRPIDYREILVFSTNNKDAVIHFEQRTWILDEDGDDSEPIFWDSGFLIGKDSGTFELVSAQKSGRVEILRGRAKEPDDETIELPFESVSIVNDDQLVRSGRLFSFSKNEIRYELKMSTTENETYRNHLTCKLTRRPAVM